MKKSIAKIMIAIVFIASNSALNAQEMPDPVEILKKSQDIFNQPGSFHIESGVKIPGEERTTSVAAYKMRSDGTYFMLLGTMRGDKLVILVRPEGTYELFPELKKAAFLKYLSVNPEDIAMMSTVKEKTKDPSLMQIKKDTYNGKHCYVISEKISQKRQDMAKSLARKSSSSIKTQENNGKHVEIPIPALKIYKISIPECQVLLQEAYDSEGNLLSSISYDSIRKEEFADSYFDVPKDYEVREVLSVEELLNWTRKGVHTK